MTKKKSSKAPAKKKSHSRFITDKHRLFAMLFALTDNAEQSAKDAGFTAATCRKKSYAWVGKSRQDSLYPELFDLVQDIKENKIQPKLEQKFDITSDKVLTEVARLGFSDIRKLFNEDGSLLPMNELDDHTAASISSVEIDELFEGSGKDKIQVGFTKKIKLWDKKGSLELLGKYFRLWKDGEITGKDGNPIETLTKIIHEVNFKKSGSSGKGD